MTRAVVDIARVLWRRAGTSEGSRALPEETPVAFVYNGCGYAVMMATPQDLEDFALGFSLTEGVIASADEILDLQTVEHEAGLELRMWLDERPSRTLERRRRHIAGPTGCGLCGLESLTEAARPIASVHGDQRFAPSQILSAIQALEPLQELNRRAQALHAAGFWRPGPGLIDAREDVGRHNAVDKLIGALARSQPSLGDGIFVITSRVSVELVQKAAAVGASMLVAVSAPTALAVRTAEAAGLTLVAIARRDGFEVFAHPHRVRIEERTDVA